MKIIPLRVLSLILAIFLTSTFFVGCSVESGNEPPVAPHVCVFTKKVTTESYKSSDATCLKKAKYFYSCECGKKGTENFEHGNLAEHVYQNNRCVWCGEEKISTTPNSPAQPEDTSRAVYVTPTGKRYHYSKSCAGKNASETTKNKAEKIGLTGCKKCT